MKNLISIILLTIASFGLMVIETSCSKDYVDVIVMDGATGPKGENGFSAVSKETLLTANGVVYGVHVEKYWDSDGVKGYSEGDEAQGSGYDILYGLTGPKGDTGNTGPVGPAGETPIVSWSVIASATCGSGSEMVFSITLNGITTTTKWCLPQGVAGMSPSLKTIVMFNGIRYIWYLDINKNGILDADEEILSDEVIKNGLSTVTKETMIFDGNTVIGIHFEKFWDSDGVKGYSEGDEPQGSGYNILYGLTGPKGDKGDQGATGPAGTNGQTGPAGETPVVAWDVIASITCESGYQLVFSVTSNNVTKTTTWCLPKGIVGEAGLNPSLKVITTSLGKIYIWYLDLNQDNIFNEGDEKLSEDLVENGTDGTNGSDATSIASSTYEYDFQGAGTSYFNSTGFTLAGGFTLADGELYFNRNTTGYVLFPHFGPNDNDLILVQFNYGSQKKAKVTVKAVLLDGTEKLIGEKIVESNQTFNYQKHDTYSHFEYKADLSNITFKNLKSIKIEGIILETLKCTNDDLFIDQVRFITKIK